MKEDQHYGLFFEAERLETFKDWPLGDKCVCTPKALAMAGFYWCGSKDAPDLARCFFCFKELEGWDPEDDPWDEHRKHSGACGFVKLGKKEKDITIEEQVWLLHDHFACAIKRRHEANKKKLEETLNEVIKAHS